MTSGLFFGVDLAWAVDRRHTGVAVMEGGLGGARLKSVSTQVRSLEHVIRVIHDHLICGPVVVAVDASLIVTNDTGQRPCERAIGVSFGRFGASCHSTNRSRPHFDSGERLVRSLAHEGFEHGLPPEAVKRRQGRWIIEVYPHPAMLRLLALDRIISYKKGRIDKRRAGLRELQASLRRLVTDRQGLKSSECLEQLLELRPEHHQGQGLKELEDRLDAVFCAFLAWYFWRWGEEKNEVFGNLETGYIVVPRA